MRFQPKRCARSIFVFWIVLGIGAATCTLQARSVGVPLSPELSPETDSADGEILSESGMELISDAFKPGEKIPTEYTCDGEDISVPLAWVDPPDSATHLVLIVEDPDAPGKKWIHWIIYNIPLGAGSLDVGVGSDEFQREIGESGLNSWGRQTYGGPCPPAGEHRYFFHAYAVDGAFKFETPPAIEQITAAMNGHVLAEAILMGVYDRDR